MLAVAVAVAVAAAAAPPASALVSPRTSARPPPLLAVAGNRVLNDEVYRAVLDLPGDALPTPALARSVRARLLDFLHRAGYELATVEVAATSEQLVATVDEGRLDKVLVFGQGALETLRMKLELSLPHAVFNRPALEAQLAELAARFGLVGVRFALVPVEHVDHVGPQLESIAALPDLSILPPAHPYELHIHVAAVEWEAGLAPDLRIDSLEGVGLGVRQRAHSLVLPEDRFELRARVAANLRTTIDEGSTQVVLSRALAEGRWSTPPLVGRSVRSFVWLRADVLNRQRGDLGLESFFYVPLDASLNLELAPLSELSLAFGAGVQHRRLFGLHRTTTLPVSPVVEQTPDRETRLFGVLSGDLVFDPAELRRDRRHELHLELRLYAETDARLGRALRAAYAYQKVFLFGWHELWLRSRGAWLEGEILFPDEEALGGAHLRGPFSGQYYARALASGGAELRFSITRDLFKVGVFHDLAGFGRLDRLSGGAAPALANAFGLALHGLFLDAFAIDTYFGLGFGPGGRFESGFLLEIDQAF